MIVVTESHSTSRPAIHTISQSDPFRAGGHHVPDNGGTLSSYFANSIDYIESQICGLLAYHNAFGTHQRAEKFNQAQSLLLERVAPLFSDTAIRKIFPQRLLAEDMAVTTLPCHDLELREILQRLRPCALPCGLIPKLGWLCGVEWIFCKLSTRENEFAPIYEARWFSSASALNNLKISISEEEHLCAGARSALSLFRRMLDAIFAPLPAEEEWKPL